MDFRVMTFAISKSFGVLHLIPENCGLRVKYVPSVSSQEGAGGVCGEENSGFCDVVIPLENVGSLWATVRAFLYTVESLDENVVVSSSEGDTLIKLYRDKPKGAHGDLTGEELTWLRIVSGRKEEQRRRIKLGPRDLLCLELACSAVLALNCSQLSSVPSIQQYRERKDAQIESTKQFLQKSAIGL